LAYAAGDINAGANSNIVGSAYTNSFNGFSNVALASLSRPGGTSGLFGINLNTGVATMIGAIGNGLTIVDIAVQQVPEPETLALAMAGLFGLFAVRRLSRRQ
jgi:hypothetical protein